MRWLDGITNTTDMNLGKFPEMVGDGGFEELDMTWRLNNKQHIGPPDTEVYKQQHLCFKWLPYMLSPLSNGSSILPIVLPHLSPAQSLGPRETVTGWRRVMRYNPNQ